MRVPEMPTQWERDLVRAFGLEGRSVVSLDLHCAVTEVPRLTVTELLVDPGPAFYSVLITKWDLHPVLVDAEEGDA